MIKLQEQNPHLVEHAPDTPHQYRKGSVDPTRFQRIHSNEDDIHTHEHLEESEELSDHERHEPEEEEEGNGFLGDHSHSNES